MTESTSRQVDLSTLTDKQLAKEFKSTGRAIKSKDPDVKTDALQKLKDVRYFTLGGCFVPLVESLAPKKKISDENRRAFDILEAFIGPPSFSGSANADIVQKSLRYVLNAGGDLGFLSVISDLAIYKEGKAKVGVSLEVPNENESLKESVCFRNTSLKALCSIVLSLSSPNKIDKGLSESFASVPTLLHSVCLALGKLRCRFDDRSTRDGMIQEGIWGLITLIFVLRNDSASMAILISSEAVKDLLAYSADESLSFYSLQIFELMSLSSVATATAYLTEQFVLRVTDILQRATEDQDFRLDITTSTSVGALTPAGKSKEKMTKKTAVVEKSERVGAVKLSPRQNLACIKVAACILAAVSKRNGSSIIADVIPRIVSYFSKVLSDKTAWELAQSVMAEPFDVDLYDVFDKCCVCLGAIGLIGTRQRRALYEALSTPILMSVLQSSMAIFDCVAVLSPALQHSLSTDDVLGSTNAGKKEKNFKCDKTAATTQLKGSRIPDTVRPVGTPEEEAEKLRKVRGLRRVAEKAMMTILSERRCDADVRNDVTVVNKRWASAANVHEIDLTMFVSSRKTAEREAPSSSSSSFSSSSSLFILEPIAINSASIPFPLTQLIEMIASSDIDLGNRGLRVLSSLLEGLKDPFALMPLLDLDVAAMTSLANTVQNRMIVMIDALENKKFEIELQGSGLLSSALNESKGYSLVNNDFKACSSIPSGKKEIIEVDYIDTDRSIREKIDGKPEILLQDTSVPTEGEGLYSSLIILEKVLAVSAVNINIFATKDRLGMVAALLYRCGLTANQKEGQESYSPVSELEVTLFDPRNFSWNIINSSNNCDKVLLRPILFDVLGLISYAEEKYRVKEGEVSSRPSARGGPPTTVVVSPCKETALCVGKLCGDAVISTLTVHARYSLQSNPNSTPHLTVLSSISNGRGSGSDSRSADISGSVSQRHVQVPVLEIQVLNAALGCLLAMLSPGANSLFAVLESVADAGFLHKETKLGNSEYSSMHKLKIFLSNLSTSSLLGSQSGEVCGVGVDLALQVAAADRKTVLSQKSTWTRSLFFDHLFTAATFSTSPATILKNPVMWPYICVCASVLGVISSVASTPKTVSIALDSILKLCKVDNISDSAQPVIADSFGTFFLAMGGATAVAGALGRFGTIRSVVCTAEEQIESHQRGVSLLTYLTNRGRDRELYWLSKVPPDASSTSDPKGAKAKEAKAAKEKLQKESKRGKSFLKVETASIVEEIAWNHEPDGSCPDPNHGPTRAFWRALLEIRCNELHTQTENGSVLIVALQGGLSAAALGLIREGAGVHITDGTGITPLMYSLYLGDGKAAEALIAAGADVDAVDLTGMPTVTYACHSMLPDDVEGSLSGPVGSNILIPISHAVGGVSSGINSKEFACVNVSVLGNTALLPLLLSGGVDVRVCSAHGNSPVLSAMGLGEMTMMLGGYRVTARNNSYTRACTREETLAAVSSLLAHGAYVNSCNLQGVVPLHIAAARGHLELIELLKQSNAIANAEDEGGFLPLHYLAAGCPSAVVEIFCALMHYSSNKAVVKMTYEDIRTGKSKAEKYESDIAQKMKEVFETSLRTSSLRSLRLMEDELIRKTSNEGLTAVHLLMSAHILKLQPFASSFSGDKYDRMNFLDYLLERYDSSLLSKVDDMGMSAMHCASLLFQGTTPQRILTAQEKRSKRVKYFPSLELKLLNNIVNLEGFTTDCVCTRLVPLQGFTLTSTPSVMDIPSSSSPFSSFCWTPIHGAIASDNVDLFDHLVQLGSRCESSFNDNYYAHFLASLSAGSAMCEQVVAACSSSSAPHNVLLNSTGGSCYNARPLHIASRSGHSNVVRRLLKCSKVDPNLRDEVTGMTAVHEACERSDLSILSIFGSVSDRLDLLMTDSSGKTCIDIAIESKNIQMLELLVRMRRNDVLERVLHARPGSTDAPSILISLEIENLRFARSLGYVLPDLEFEDGGYVEEKSEEKSGCGLKDEILVDRTMVESMKKMKLNNETSSSSLIEAVISSTILDGSCMTESGLNGVDQLSSPSSLLSLPLVHVAVTEEMLSVSNQIVKILVVAAFEAGISSREFHAHSCFSQGSLYTEHVRVSQE